VLSGKIASLVTQGANVNTLWETFKTDLTKAADEFIPSSQRTHRFKLPWINGNLRRLLNRKKRLYRQAKKSGDWKNYRFIQKECKRSFRKAEWDFLNSVIVNGLQENDSKPFWKYIKSKKQDNIGVAPLKHNNQLCSDSKGKADILLQQFKSVFSTSTSPSKVPLPRYPTIKDLHIRQEGVEKLLKSIQVGKAPGPDSIPNRLLKECASELAEGLTCIFRKSINSGELPNDWTKANVAPVFKKGDRHLGGNYRPVSLTSVSCKLLEHIIYCHLMSHLKQYGILTDLNHGFRAGFSCETQLAVTAHDLCLNFEKGIQTDVAILDFSKAFDTVPHTKLLDKLHSYGIQGHLHDWLRFFLTQRQMRVVVEGQFSDEAAVKSGVPQGTVLGPLLFLCHINDLPKSVKSQVRLFADDCLLYRQIRKRDDHVTLQKDLDNLEQWAHNWGMKFNASKCYILSIQQKSSQFYQLSGQILQQVQSNPYLGVVFNENLKWSEHIAEVAKKANSILGLLRRNLRFCPQNCRRTAYISLVRSKLEYADVIWDPYEQGDIDKLEKVQRRSARFVCQDYRSRTPGCVTNMLANLNLPPLQERRREHRLSFLYKVADNALPGIPPDKYINQIRGKRKIIPKRNSAFVESNIVERMARNNSRSYELKKDQTAENPKSLIFKNSFLPRTVLEWNTLDDATVSAESIEAFKRRLSTTAAN
jgi:hypothetical protein